MKISLLSIFLIFTGFLFGQAWKQHNDVTAPGRDDGLAFSIQGKGYVVTGNQDGFATSNKLWQFDPVSDSWTEKTTFPGNARQYAGVFVLNGLAYVMCGYSSSNQALKDVWQYNAEKDTWQQMNDFPGLARWTFFTFSADNMGFLGAGAVQDSSLADCWKYNPNMDEWNQIADYPGGRMREVVGVGMANKCFAGTGLNVNPLSFSKEFFEYNWRTDIWTQIEDFPGGVRAYVGGQGIGLSAVIGGGWGLGSQFKSDFYQLSVDGDWTKIASAPIQGWRGMSTFSIDGRAYFLTGLYANVTRTSNVFSINIGDDYFPMLFPNPSSTDGIVYFLPNNEVNIYSHSGQLVNSGKTNADGYYSLPELPIGSYLIHLPYEENKRKQLRWVVR